MIEAMEARRLTRVSDLAFTLTMLLYTWVGQRSAVATVINRATATVIELMKWGLGNGSFTAEAVGNGRP